MKIKNIGTANFVVKDKRGNSVTLEPNCTVEVDEKIGKKVVRVYSFIQEIVEKKDEIKEVVKEEKEEVKDVSRETKKKRKK